ncbi:hypothetical protein ACLB2K_059058 [Fragaria x ananassa]
MAASRRRDDERRYPRNGEEVRANRMGPATSSLVAGQPSSMPVKVEVSGRSGERREKPVCNSSFPKIKPPTFYL